MLLDAQNLFSSDQDLSQVAGTYHSTNVIDLGVAGTDVLGNTVIADIGRGRHLELLVQVTETFASTGAATLTVHLQTAAALSSGDLSSPTTIMSTPALAKGVLVAGYQLRLAIPPGIAQRYMALSYVIGTETTSAGTITAGIVEAKQTNPSV